MSTSTNKQEIALLVFTVGIVVVIYGIGLSLIEWFDDVLTWRSFLGYIGLFVMALSAKWAFPSQQLESKPLATIEAKSE